MTASTTANYARFLLELSTVVFLYASTPTVKQSGVLSPFARQTSEKSFDMATMISKTARDALAATDWHSIDAMTDDDIARQIASNRDAAPDMAPEIDVRAIRRASGMTQAQFAAAYEFSIRTVQEWERGAKKPSGPARTLLRAIRADPEGLRRVLAAG